MSGEKYIGLDVHQATISAAVMLKHGNKSDKIDARKLADLLRLNDLEPVYHGETGVRMLRELAPEVI
jgi:hypothetical protein